MQKIFENYIQSISSKFVYKETSEMGYRTDFEILLKGIFEKVIEIPRIDHDPKSKQGNKPDFIVMKHEIPILYIEAKDIGVPLDKIEKSEQMARYYGYANLVLTDYVEFRFYRNGQRYDEPIKIADYDINNRTISPLPNNYEHAAKTLIDFTQSHKEPIKSGLHLAKIMGGKAQRIRDNLLQFISVDSEKNSEINKIYNTLKKLLVHDLKIETFADMYAQTLVYGLFVARYFDTTPEDFSRREARELVPKSNPFLRHFFDHITGADFDKRLEFIVDELCEVFSHANVPHLMKQYFKDDLWGKTHEGPDPVIHFYEDFLREYDPVLRKKMGAYYTPQPVVRFIVRAVDYLLKKEFGLPSGLADTTKLKNGTHKVQILDPAVGTGTFLSAVIRSIYLQLKETGQIGRWTSYVHHDLLPRIHGFEIMMAPYTIAHLKLSMAFKATGFKHFNRRLGIYLTNSLEEPDNFGDLFTGFGFAESIAEESKEAAVIKNEIPVMVVIGNPPYSGVSSNETKYANSLVSKYKVEPGGKNKLQERKHWLHDDYVKFMAFAEHMIEKTGEGILGFITNHGYLDNPTFRGMRWHLMDTFDSIYIIDLHGNTNKKEKTPSGDKDENVFDIQQGVAIILATKQDKKRNNKLAQVHHLELWGKREDKFRELNNISFDRIKWKTLSPRTPNLFFIPDSTANKRVAYYKGFIIPEIFQKNTSGIVTMGDSFVIDENKAALQKRLDKFTKEELTVSYLNDKYKLGKNYAEWIIENKSSTVIDNTKIVPYLYRPFDVRYSYFDNKLLWRPRTKIMQHFIRGINVGLIVPKQLAPSEVAGAYITNTIGGHKTFSAYNSNYYFPLYIYHEDGTKIPNLKKEIVDKIEKIVGSTSPEDILDYIYAVLHSSSYRVKYKEFLKIDFPRVPYPKDKTSFKKLVNIGTELRSLHLLESPKVNQFITTYPVPGSNDVEKIKFEPSKETLKQDLPDGSQVQGNIGKVFINKEQYFGKVPQSAWEFYIGGYQPAQKWLKDRKGRTLTNSDIEHYQKIIVALSETERIMKEIDKVIKY